MNKTLAHFLKYLEEHNLIDFSVICAEDYESDAILYDDDYDPEVDPVYINEKKIQKYVFIGKRFGLDVPYKHSKLIFGPHSTSLTDDYVKISENHKEMYDDITLDLPKSFRSQEFLDFVNGKDIDWLEVSSSLIFWNEEHVPKDELVEVVRRTKAYSYPIEYVSNILEEIKHYGLLKIEMHA
jgi:uncharacterized protein YwgA